MHGKQYRKKTGARSWAGAEEAKKVLEAQLTGGTFCLCRRAPRAACPVRLLKPSRPIN